MFQIHWICVIILISRWKMDCNSTVVREHDIRINWKRSWSFLSDKTIPNVDIREVTFVTEWTVTVVEDNIYSTFNSHVLDKIIPTICLSRSRTSRSACLMNDEWMDVVSLVPPMSRNSQDKNIQRCRDRTRLTLERSRLLDWGSFHCHP